MHTLLARLANSRKALTPLVTGAIGWGYVVVASAPAAPTAKEWLGLAVVGGTAAGVWKVTNKPLPGA